MRLAALALILPMLSACTLAVVEKSKGDVVSPGRAGVTTRLVSASVMRPAGGAGDAHLYLCFGRSSPAGWREKFFLVRLPERYPFADEARQGEPFRKLGNMLVLSAGTPSDAVANCDAPRGQAVIEQIAVLVGQPSQTVLLPDGTREAIVVSYSDTRDGLGLAYLSASPVFGGYSHISLDLRQSALYSERDGAKPYLLLLTPVTLAGDAVLGATAGVALVIGITVACWDEPRPCH